MCDICRQMPCHSRCPQAADQTGCRCRHCHEEIWPDQEVYKSSQGPICVKCMEEMTLRELMKLLDRKFEVV